MNRNVARFCAWSGPMFVLFAFPGYVLAGLLPPTSPGLSPADAAALWADNADWKKLGLWIMLLAACFQVPFGALMAVRMKQIEGDRSPMAYVMIAGSATALLAITMPAFFYAGAAFRADRDPAAILSLHDMGWILFVMNTPPALLQCGSLAFAILGDRSSAPVFPRWVGYYNLWTAFLFLPGGACLLFAQGGVLAWNGLLSFWVVAVLFGGWFWVMGFVLHRTCAPDSPANSSRRDSQVDALTVRS